MGRARCHGRPPDDQRQLSTWLGEDDLVQLVTRSIEAEGIGHVAVWGISANTRSFYDLSEGNDVGYEPHQNAEFFAAAVEAKPNPYVTVTEDGRERHKKKRRERRRDHRHRNPTLDQVGGLPPPRDPHQITPI